MGSFLEKNNYKFFYLGPIVVSILFYIISWVNKEVEIVKLDRDLLTIQDTISVPIFFSYKKHCGETTVWANSSKSESICKMRGFIRSDSLIDELKRCNSNNFTKSLSKRLGPSKILGLSKRLGLSTRIVLLKISLKNESWFNCYSEETFKKYKYGYIEVSSYDTVSVSLNRYIEEQRCHCCIDNYLK